MGRADLIGNGKHHLIPTYQPLTDGTYQSARRSNSTQAAPASGATGAAGKAAAARPKRGGLLTQHTGLPPRAGTGGGTKTAATKAVAPKSGQRDASAKPTGKAAPSVAQRRKPR